MRAAVYLVMCILLLGCSAKKAFYESGGSSIRMIDSNDRKNVKVLQIGNRTAVIFPSSYAKQLLGRSDTLKKFFTADIDLIKKVESKLQTDYCRANLLFSKKSFDTLSNHISTPTVGELISNKECERWQKNYSYYDQQFVSYPDKSRERIVLIQLIDFREDPYHLKESFENLWIMGWHGWYYSNIIQLHYHVDKNLLTIGEDI